MTGVDNVLSYDQCHLLNLEQFRPQINLSSQVTLTVQCFSDMILNNNNNGRILTRVVVLVMADTRNVIDNRNFKLYLSASPAPNLWPFHQINYAETLGNSLLE